MRSVDEVYETFTSYVAEGRNLPLEKVLDIAGRTGLERHGCSLSGWWIPTAV